jgi:phosphatidylserine/phosphatidylglycerophosphate/cardiolipin synthase-like enzyme
VVIDGQETLVTSANFTAAAQERNIELGLLVNSPDVAFRVERHFEALIKGGHLERLPILQR